jgi:hypothetical protein
MWFPERSSALLTNTVVSQPTGWTLLILTPIIKQILNQFHPPLILKNYLAKTQLNIIVYVISLPCGRYWKWLPNSIMRHYCLHHLVASFMPSLHELSSFHCRGSWKLPVQIMNFIAMKRLKVPDYIHRSAYFPTRHILVKSVAVPVTGREGP